MRIRGALPHQGKWVEVDHDRLKETLQVFEQAQKLAQRQDVGLLDAMRLQWDAQRLLRSAPEAVQNPDIFEISQGEWLRKTISGLTRPEILPVESCGDDFRATLRDYQKRGLSWLSMMKQLGLGVPRGRHGAWQNNPDARPS